MWAYRISINAGRSNNSSPNRRQGSFPFTALHSPRDTADERTGQGGRETPWPSISKQHRNVTTIGMVRSPRVLFVRG